MANLLLIPIIICYLVPIAVAVDAPPPVMAAAAVADDRSALLAFLSNVSADSGGVALADWGRSPEFCNWTGVVCGGGERRRVTQLVLAGRGLRGVVSPALGRLEFVTVLDLSNNGFSGEIPAELASLSRLTQLSLTANRLEGAIPAGIGLLRRLYFLDLSGNRLSGGIPATLFCNCTALQYVDLANNSLAGDIPYSGECRLPSLRYLLLWSNDLSGPIPPALSNSSLLEWVDFESNYLAGELPPQVFDRLPRLHEAAVGRLVDVEDYQAAAEREHPRISYRELAEATGGFVQSSLIGAGRFGRVYEGTLRGGARVAVKVLDPKGGGEVSGSFKRECEVLRRTRHKNLVRVITTCSTATFHALVLPLMPHGSLEGHLYPPERGAGGGDGLDFGRLMSVVSDVAEGLAYLHHYAPVRVVHCDLKPSNVLLDDDMRAVISDFGIAKLISGAAAADGDGGASSTSDESAPCNSITGLLQGSVGYIAPEYGLGGHPSRQGDVYSFGVMILELITGKRPTDVIFHEGLTLHDWVRRHYPHDVAAVVAHAPWRREAPSPMSTAASPAAADVAAVELIELGLVCTQHSPALRPSMVDVCHEITLLNEAIRRHAAAAAAAIAAATDEDDDDDDGRSLSTTKDDSLFSN
uniref:non-specific serine/threonine protein kinase n=1 Tax=Oryza barthii TaxID=65489 RepID=A0A0D3GDM1_9ORYZ